MKNMTSVESMMMPANPATPKMPPRGSRSTAIMLFTFVAFFASGVRAQTKVIVDPSESGNQNEPSIAVRPWDTSGNPDGKTIIASWQQIYDGWHQTYTSKSTDAGQTWTVSTYISGKAGDAKLAYRQTGSPAKPQLLCAYMSDYSNAGWVHVAFSSNDGTSWGTVSSIAPPYEDDSSSVRPLIATDKSDSSAYKNNAYVCWSEIPFAEPEHIEEIDSDAGWAVRVATIAADSTAPTQYAVIYQSTGAVKVDACDIAVASDGTVLLLWEKRYTSTVPNTRDLYIAVSTDGGATWNADTTHPVATGLTAPGVSNAYDNFLGNSTGFNDSEYQDYPALAISEWGSYKTVFVAYTKGTTNPDDLFLTSAAYSWGGTIGSWGTPTMLGQIEPYSGTYTPDPFSEQFQPAICPDGKGGAYLLYYSQQDTGSTPLVIPVIYETPDPGYSGGTHHAISDPSYAFTHIESSEDSGIGDYIGIAYDPVLGIAHPIWTDYNWGDGTYDVYTASLSGNEIVGNLGFSNQRRAVMAGGSAHLAGFGELTPSATVNKRHAIWYNEQSTPFTGWATGFSSPLELDNGEFDNYTNSSGPYSDDFANSRTPSIGVYQQNSTGKKAVAVVWAARPDFPGGYCSEMECVFIRVKEWDTSENGDIADWSQVDSIWLGAPGTASPVVAPITAPVSDTSKDRYLIGWVVTVAGEEGELQSATYLRGQQNAPEGSNPATNTETKNESWGPHKGTWTPNTYPLVPFTLVNDYPSDYRLTSGFDWHTHGSFVSVTSNESNGNGTGGSNSDVTPGTCSQTVVFTGDGTLPYSGVWEVNATYATAGPMLGELLVTTPPVQLNNGDPTPPFGYYVFSDGHIIDTSLPHTYAFERNPSVTITSTGQKIAAWEETDDSTLGFHSSIRIAKTMAGGSWDPIQDAIIETTNDASWSWLLNPSVTAFPKTLLTDATTSSDQDPGAAELLYWKQHELVPPIAGGTKTLDNYILEQQFYEYQGDNHIAFSGNWNTVSPSWYPGPGINYIGANSQRSFGIYNTGPKYITASALYQLFNPDGSTPYVHGLSYGIANAISGGVVLPILTTPSPDYGAAKGTFAEPLGVQLYRSEQRREGSSMVAFKWGKVYVEDTALGEPFREVMLHNGPVDSSGYASHNAMRDSIFATEWFDWPVSAEIKYDRLMLIPSAGVLTFNIDTIVDRDTLGDSTFVYDTVAGAFIRDTTRRSDSAFFAPGTQMTYTVQLVHRGGHIDTIEQAVYKPSLGKFITPMTVHIDNAGYAGDTVMLRVIGSFTNVPDSNSLVQFTRETMLDTYPSDGDTTLAIGTGGGIVAPPDSCFSADGPFSNPSDPGANDVSILVHYCALGSTITAQVYNSLGFPVGSASTYTSDGQTWDRLPITAPGTSGSYYIAISAGSYFTTLGYSVY